MTVIEVQNLEKRYGATAAVRGVSFAIEPARCSACSGRTGPGRRRRSRSSRGTASRARGGVSVLGHDPSRGERALRDRIGVVLQETSIAQDLTVGELLEMHARWYSRSRSVDELIALVELDASRDTRAGTLSGGQRRRLDLALGLVGDPDVLFLDEPTTGFDPHARRQAWTTIRSLCELGKTVVLTTHYMDEAQRLADRVAVMVAGEDRRDRAAREPRRPRRAADRDPLHPAAGRRPRRSAARCPRPRSRRTTTASSSRRPRACAAIHALSGWALERDLPLAGLTVSQPTLEDVYLALTRRRARGGAAMTTTAFTTGATSRWPPGRCATRSARSGATAAGRSSASASRSCSWSCSARSTTATSTRAATSRSSTSTCPGIVAYAIILTCFNTTALGFAALRANGVLKRLRVTPLPWWVFVAGTVGSTFVVVSVSIALMLALGIVAFGAHLHCGDAAGLPAHAGARLRLLHDARRQRRAPRSRSPRTAWASS